MAGFQSVTEYLVPRVKEALRRPGLSSPLIPLMVAYKSSRTIAVGQDTPWNSTARECRSAYRVQANTFM